MSIKEKTLNLDPQFAPKNLDEHVCKIVREETYGLFNGLYREIETLRTTFPVKENVERINELKIENEALQTQLEIAEKKLAASPQMMVEVLTATLNDLKSAYEKERDRVKVLEIEKEQLQASMQKIIEVAEAAGWSRVDNDKLLAGFISEIFKRVEVAESLIEELQYSERAAIEKAHDALKRADVVEKRLTDLGAVELPERTELQRDWAERPSGNIAEWAEGLLEKHIAADRLKRPVREMTAVEIVLRSVEIVTAFPAKWTGVGWHHHYGDSLMLDWLDKHAPNGEQR